MNDFYRGEQGPSPEDLEHASLMAERDKYHRETQDLKVECSRLKQELSWVKAELLEARAENEGLSAERDHFRIALSTTQKLVTDSEILIADLKAEVERLKDLVVEVQNRTVVVVRQRAIDDHLDIVAGFAREAAYSGERHVLMLVAQAIRDRK